MRATDGAGNTDASPASFTWTIDTTDPSPAFTFPAAGGFYNLAGWSDFAGTASDAGGAALQNVELSIKRDSDDQYWNGTAFADGTENWRTATGTASWSLSFPGANFAAEGAYTVRLRATDTAGNVAAPATRAFSVDTTAPNTSITAQPNDPTNATGASFSFSASEGGTTFECQLDGGGWSSCSSPKSYSGLGQGSHTFEVRATDAAGNTDLSPASFTWTIDTTAPNTTITAQPSDPSNVTGPSFSFSSSEGGSTFECQLDGGGWSSCSSPKSYTGLEPGLAHLRGARHRRRRQHRRHPGDRSPGRSTRPRRTRRSPRSPATRATRPPLTSPSAPARAARPSSASSTAAAGPPAPRPKSYTGLSQGSHTFEVRATDAAGNTDATPASFTWTIDTTAPASVVTFPASGGIYSSTAWADIEGTASDGVALDKVEVSIKRVADNQYWNGTAFADGTENWRLATGTASWSLAFPTANFPADDDYVVRVRATDTAANPETPNAYSLTYDTAAPNTTITAQPSDPTNATGASFSFSATEGGSTFECQLDGGGWSSCASPKVYSGLSQGSHTFQVRATDAAGNPDATPASFTWTIDTAAPNTTITAQPSDPSNSTGADFSFTSSEGGSTFECQLDGGGWSSCTSPEELHRPERRLAHLRGARDRRRRQHRPDARELHLDDRHGRARHHDHRAAERPVERHRAELLVQLLRGRLDLRVPARRRRLVLLHLAQGLHRPEPTARTPSRSARPTPRATPTRPRDASPGRSTPPRRTRRSPRSRTTRATRADPDFSFSSSEGGSTFECQLDGGGWSSCASPKSYTGLSDGSHTFEVRATDAAGNTDGTPASFTWTVDTAAPNTTITAQPSDPSNSADADFSFSSSEGGSTFECRIDGGAWSSCSSPKSHTGLSDGSHTFEVRATDGAGNTDPTPASFTWTIDTTAPNTTITAQPNDPSNVTGPSFSFNSSEGGSTFECQLDGGGWSSCSSPKSYAGLTQGSHTFQVRATDAAGNTDASPASFTWTIDTTDPSSAITFPAAAGFYNTATWNDFSGTASDAGGAALDKVEVSIKRDADDQYWNGTAFADGTENWRVATGTASWTLAFASGNFPGDGDYTMRVRATDTAGNVQAPLTRAFAVDTVAPETSITAQPNDPTNATGASFSFTADQPGSTFDCKLDGGVVRSCTSPKSYSGLAAGSHTFQVRATDPAGNPDLTPASFTWTIDTARRTGGRRREPRRGRTSSPR